MNLDTRDPMEREQFGEILIGATYKKYIACGKLYITINHNQDGEIVEVLVDSGKSGGCKANVECLGRMIALACRSGIKISTIANSIVGVKCEACANMKGKKKSVDGNSCGDVVGKALLDEYKKLKSITVEKFSIKETEEVCHAVPQRTEDNINVELETIIGKVPPIEPRKENNTYVDKEGEIINRCPECGRKLSMESGCNICYQCGYSKCS